MKKIFYKIFIYFCLAAYLPLLLIYVFNFFYVDKYIVEEKKNTLIEIAEQVNIDRLKKIKKEDISQYKTKKDIKKYNSEIYIRYINLEEKSNDTDFFKLFNQAETKIDINNLELNNYDIKTVKLSALTNHFFLIKKISDYEIIVVVGEIISSEVVTAIIFAIYKRYTMLIIPILLIGSCLISKKFSEPIETLEKISTQISNSDFTEKIEIKSKNELESLGNNINKMANKLEKNIEELNDLNEQLKKELKEKEKLLETEKSFMRAIGHELKTPVAIINGYIEALQDNMITHNEIKKTYEIIYKEGMNINKIVKDINHYFKSEFKDIITTYETISIKEIIETSIKKYNLDIKQKNIKLKLNLENIEIKTDIELFNIILNNLITNAIAYVDERKELEINLTKDRLIISNSSEYISKDNFEKIFTPFYKIDKSRNRKYGGTGLGLSIVKNLLEILNLSYSFTYDINKKSAIFTIKIIT